MQLPPYLAGILAILVFSSFVKVLTSLSILRFGLGLEGFGFGFVTLALSLMLSILVLEPHLKGQGGVEALFSGTLNLNSETLNAQMMPFFERHSRPEITARLSQLTQSSAQAASTQQVKTNSLSILTVSFLISELSEAFRIGLLFILPFVILDLMVANALLALGVKELSYQIVSFPLKLLLFVAVGGWNLVAGKLLEGYF